MVVMGVDAGGTKTICRIANQNGQTLVETRGSGANLQQAGAPEVRRVLEALLSEAVREAAVEPMVVCVGMAGVDRAGDAATVRQIVQGILPSSECVVVNDALIALEAGAPGEPGVVLISGTGSIAYGRNREGAAARAGGWGYLLGDEGSGYWLGRQALQAVVRAADGRGPHTLLTPRVLEHFHVSRSQDLVRQVYDGSFAPATVAAVAIHVESAAAEGDDIALLLIDTGARELGLAALSVCSRLGLMRGPVVLAGGMFAVAPSLKRRAIAHLTGRLATMVVRSSNQQPVAGAVSLALAAARGSLQLPVYLDT